MQAFGHFMAFLPKSLIGNQIRFFRFYPTFRLFPTFRLSDSTVLVFLGTLFLSIWDISGYLAMNWKIFHIFAPWVPFLWVPRLDFYSDIPEIPRPIWEYPKLQVYPEYRLLADISGYLLPKDFEIWVGSGWVSKKMFSSRSGWGTRRTLLLVLEN